MWSEGNHNEDLSMFSSQSIRYVCPWWHTKISAVSFRVALASQLYGRTYTLVVILRWMKVVFVTRTAWTKPWGESLVVGRLFKMCVYLRLNLGMATVESDIWVLLSDELLVDGEICSQTGESECVRWAGRASGSSCHACRCHYEVFRCFWSSRWRENC